MIVGPTHKLAFPYTVSLAPPPAVGSAEAKWQYAIALSLVVLAVNERLQERSTHLFRFAFIAGLFSALLFFILGWLRFTGYPYLANQYSGNPEVVSTAYNSYLVVDMAIDHAAIFTSGLWLVLVNWVALNTDLLPRLLSYFGMVTGVAGIIGSILPSFAPLALLLYIVWFLWFGIRGVINRGVITQP